MKRVMSVLLLVASLLLCATAQANVVIWEEGFENGFPANVSISGLKWKLTSSVYAHSGDTFLDIEGPANAACDIATFDLSSVGYTGITLEYWYLVREGLEGTDAVYAQWTSDGTHWQTPTIYAQQAVGEWTLASFVLPASTDDNADLEVCFCASFDTGGERFHLDDFKLFGTPIPEPATLMLAVIGGVMTHSRRRRISQ